VPGDYVTAPTHAARKVLAAKGLPAITIQSACQRPEKLTRKGELYFSPHLPQAFLEAPARRFIIDEASMVGHRLLHDLKCMHPAAEVLRIGDGFQLPPVTDRACFPSSPDVELTDVFRQATGNRVLNYATALRSGDMRHLDEVFEARDIDVDDVEALFAGEAVIITATNRERMDYIKRLRQGAFGAEALPQVGETLIAYGSHEKQLYYNGDTAKVIGPAEEVHTAHGYGNLILIPVELEDGRRIELKTRMNEMLDPDQIKNANVRAAGVLHDKAPKSSHYQDLWTFAYAITGHKSQGRQWRRVYIPKGTTANFMDVPERWLYTAVTRAEEEVILV